MEIGLFLGLAAVAVVGLIEWLKNFLKEFLAIPGWAWSVAVLVVSFLCGALVVYGSNSAPKTVWMAVLAGLVVLALAQIGYDGIVKAIAKKAANVLTNEKVD
ncbi:hypothetical protein [Candidatus Avelusimicrobium fimicolum]|jgi:hypothetical protein|uniref:hypothetical protein n=1 Tax=Candidatus Avelusimicrobium fimicolum TaxID=3416216 RepID=UPI003D0C87C3